MIAQLNIQQTLLIKIKNLKMGELGIAVNGQLINHILMRTGLGVISLTDPNIGIKDNTQASEIIEVRILTHDESITLMNHLPKKLEAPKTGKGIEIRKPKRKYAEKRGPSQKMIEELSKLRKEGYSLREIGELLKVSPMSISNWCSKYNIGRN